MKGFLACLAASLMSLTLTVSSAADDLDQGKQMLAQGDLTAAAEFFNKYAVAHPDSKKAAEALTLCARSLDALADNLTGQAEKACYWVKGGGRTPECMQGRVSQYNQRFGEGALRYEHAITYIYYTGSHYKEVLDSFPKSEYAPEADFYLLLHDLIGHPDTVLPKIKAYLTRHPKGEWNRRARLLWARVNEDIWYIHRKWSWVLYNYQISPEELIIRAEPYRQEALRTYERLMKEPTTFEGKAAEREYALLKDNKEDQTTYSIVNDSVPGTLASWGVATSMASPYQMAPDKTPGSTSKGSPEIRTSPQPPPQLPTPAPTALPSEAPEEKSPNVPKRWQ